MLVYHNVPNQCSLTEQPCTPADMTYIHMRMCLPQAPTSEQQGTPVPSWYGDDSLFHLQICQTEVPWLPMEALLEVAELAYNYSGENLLRKKTLACFNEGPQK